MRDNGQRVVLITGDRNWGHEGEDFHIMAIAFNVLRTMGFKVIVHGDCSTGKKQRLGRGGADRLADHLGKSQGFVTVPNPADWHALGKKAGPVRNRKMYDSERPDVVVGFHRKLWASSGTLDMMKYAEGEGTPVYLIHDVHTAYEFLFWLKHVLAPNVETGTGEADLSAASGPQLLR